MRNDNDADFQHLCDIPNASGVESHVGNSFLNAASSGLIGIVNTFPDVIHGIESGTISTILSMKVRQS